MESDDNVLILYSSQTTYPTLVVRFISSILTPIILVFFVQRLWRYYNLSTADSSSDLPLPPGSFGLPFIGETLNLILGADEFFKKRRTELGNVYKTHLLGQPTVRVIGRENVRKILLGENKLVTTWWPASTRRLMGTGALSHSVGIIHRKRRKLIAKAFTHDALERYCRPMQRAIKRHVIRWCEDGYILGYQEAKYLTFALAARVLLGFHFTRRDIGQLLAVFNDLVDNLFSLPYNIPGSGFHKGMKAREKLLETIEKQIVERMNSPEDHDDALWLLMNASDDDGTKLSMMELKEACLELLFAGHETTASAACTTMMQLAQKPEVVQKIQAELEEHAVDDVEGMKYDELHRLTYLNRVIKEVLRVAPPVGAGFRKAIKTFEIDGMQVPKGWSVAYSIRDTQCTSKLFENVSDFDPDRWSKLSNNDQDSAHFDYLPFGGGPRACVGREYAGVLLKTLTIALVQNSVWSMQNEKPKMKLIPVPHPIDGLPLEFTEAEQIFRPRSHTV
ncbi:cytochrome P450 26A1-like [Tubulanus polymorphus]|uniref:cytochrome P450 26A1-like n=1 Tax=Tubulanus polymorphus TaxID=672921 RepID=UPI003DA6CD9C